LAGAVSMVCFVVPDWFAFYVLMLVGLITPPALVSGIVYGRGYVRAFAIGALISATWLFTYISYDIPYRLLSGDTVNVVIFSYVKDLTRFKIGFAIHCLMTTLSGLTAVGVRWMCLRTKPGAAQKVAPTLAGIKAMNVSEMEITPRDKAELYAILQGRVGD
jgi:hypothetical protein